MRRAAFGSSEHNGNQELVYHSIARGNALLGDVMADTGLEEETVRTAIMRLRDAGRIAREHSTTKRHNVRYVPVASRCLLAEVWR